MTLHDHEKGMWEGELDGDDEYEAVVWFYAENDLFERRFFVLVYDFEMEKVPAPWSLSQVISPDPIGLAYRYETPLMVDFGNDGQTEIAVLDDSEKMLVIYTYVSGGYRSVFAASSPCRIEISPDEAGPDTMVKVGRTKSGGDGCNEPASLLWEVYAWEQNRLIYNAGLSTAPERKLDFGDFLPNQ